VKTDMDWLTNLIWHQGKLFGIEWSVWKVVGWLGNAIFGSRFFVQWYATEKLRRVVVPAAFWWLSLAGSLLLLSYSLHKHDSVFIFAYLFTWIPYIRNLVIQRRHAAAHLDCPQCNTLCPPQSVFCYACGTRLSPAVERAPSV
jgi:lipid-A-disaccharide synthase-like uncharacterized protein